jgi:A/G-specific adenine glycosylase
MTAPAETRRFRRLLLNWFNENARDLPWRRTRDPYAIWVSEIMLQQTRVSAVTPFYERFLARFPSVEALAGAAEADLLAQWAGLGYYHRARNLQRAAKQIVGQGRFPGSFDEIRALPGIGDYTAAAVASIAFGLPHAVVDGNVLRVLSRLLNDSTDIATAEGKRTFSRAANELLNRERPGDHNQALMELGATVCLPKNPQCLVCPLSEHCGARAAGTVDRLPVKTKVQNAVREERTLYWIERGEDLLMWERPRESRLMAGFWELPEAEQIGIVEPLAEFGEFGHSITFHRYRFRVVSAAAPGKVGGVQWVAKSRLAGMPLSTIARKAIRLVGRVRHPAAGANRQAAGAR